LPCRHILAIASRGKEYFKNLPFAKRWRINFFVETADLKDPPRLPDVEETLELQEVTMVKSHSFFKT